MDQILQIFIGLMAVISIQSLLLIFIIWKTPALTFLMASLFKKPVMYIMGKDHMGYFRTFKPKAGAAHIKGVGLFNLTENSHTLEGGSKVPIYFAFRDLAATLLPEYPAIIQEIREHGFIVNSMEDIGVYIDRIKKGTIANPVINIRPYKSYKMHDLANMFPYNLDPTFIDSTVQCEVSMFMKKMKAGQMALATIVVVIIVGAIAVFILNMAFKGKINASDCTNMIQAACNSVPGAVKSAVNTVPLG